MDLYRRGAMVSELESYWCMPAAMQTIINIIEATGRTGRMRPSDGSTAWPGG